MFELELKNSIYFIYKQRICRSDNFILYFSSKNQTTTRILDCKPALYRELSEQNPCNVLPSKRDDLRAFFWHTVQASPWRLLVMTWARRTAASAELCLHQATRCVMENLFTICQKNARKSSRFDGKTLQGFFSDNSLYNAGLQSKILVVVWFLELKYKIKLSLLYCRSEDSLFIYEIDRVIKFKLKQMAFLVLWSIFECFFWFSKPITTLMWSFQRIPVF